jgi:hypothetical protein
MKGKQRKLLITSIDADLYKRLKRCQLEIGCFRHQRIVTRAIEDWCEEVEKYIKAIQAEK